MAAVTIIYIYCLFGFATFPCAFCPKIFTGVLFCNCVEVANTVVCDVPGLGVSEFSFGIRVLFWNFDGVFTEELFLTCCEDLLVASIFVFVVESVVGSTATESFVGKFC